MTTKAEAKEAFDAAKQAAATAAGPLEALARLMPGDTGRSEMIRDTAQGLRELADGKYDDSLTDPKDEWGPGGLTEE